MGYLSICGFIILYYHNFGMGVLPEYASTIYTSSLVG